MNELLEPGFQSSSEKARRLSSAKGVDREHFADHWQVKLKGVLNALVAGGISRKQIAVSVGVHASTVTRWFKRSKASRPLRVLELLDPLAKQIQKEKRYSTAPTVSPWAAILSHADPIVRSHAEQTGLLAETAWVISCVDRDSLRQDHFDAVVHKYFQEPRADVSKKHYNIGDQTQTVSGVKSADPPNFDQGMPIGNQVSLDVSIVCNAGLLVGSLHVQLQLSEKKGLGNLIQPVSDFGYRFRATQSVVQCQIGRQTNEFLGAVVPVSARRLRLIVCIPRAILKGAPDALSVGNRSMVPLLMEWDRTGQSQIDAFLWQGGRKHEISNSPSAPFQRVERPAQIIEQLPELLLQELNKPMNLVTGGMSTTDVLKSPLFDSFLLDLTDPNPFHTHLVVWRLPSKS